MALNSKWKSTIDDAIDNSDWDEYDDLIKREVAGYRTRFSGSNADWKLFKAVVWTESGGPDSDTWGKRAMQIGNPGDPAYAVLRGGKEGADIILSDTLKRDLQSGNINDPELNIRAGIGYVYVRLANTRFESVMDTSDTTDHDYTVVSGDSFDAIAKKVGTTIQVLQDMNPTLKVLHAKDTIKYRKASVQRVLKSWRPFTSKTIAQYYNAGGDASYAEKLDYCLSVMGKLKRTPK
jgi:LysM domain